MASSLGDLGLWRSMVKGESLKQCCIIYVVLSGLEHSNLTGQHDCYSMNHPVLHDQK